jgi:hypothetical protein
LKGAAMNKPKEKWWTVTKFDVGRGLANPDYVQWADERIAALEAEVAKFTPTNSRYATALEVLTAYRLESITDIYDYSAFRRYCAERLHAEKHRHDA